MTDRYIIRFMPDTDQSVIDKIMKDIELAGGNIIYRYTTISRGFAAKIPNKMLEILKAHEKIEAVDADRVVYLH